VSLLMAKPETISASKFKATCLGVLEKVRKSGRPVVVTKFGKPIVEVIPARLSKRGSDWIGSMEGTCQIVGDIVGPIIDESEWEALRD
jgi:prevent-host-death family protein